MPGSSARPRYRHDYLDYAALTAQLREWADTDPAFVRLRSLGRSPEGRELWLLSVGAAVDARGPAVWVDGNMHAVEVAGSSVALAVAEAVIRLHKGEATGLDPRTAEAVRRVTFHVLPRLSPDGAEAVLKTGRYLRSVPRDAREPAGTPRWLPGDVDGDGLALTMRVRDPAGDCVECPEFPGLMRFRQIDDSGPFYRLYPEGLIEHFDGHSVPDPDFLSDNSPDLNRNFPYDWAPEERQAGAGPYPLSEPESRAVAEFVQAHPEIFAWLNLHTFGGVFIRPPGGTPDTDMDAFDLAVYRQVGHWAESLTDYPMVSGHDEFTYEPGRPLRGDVVDYAYHQRGCLAMACEIWDLFRRLGLERKRPFVDHYSHLEPEDLVRLAEWDASENEGRIVRPWRAFTHPQLGAVELGGWDPRVGIFNPPYEALAGIGEGVAALWLRVAALAPQVEISPLEAIDLGGGIARIEAVVRNRGYLPSYGLSSAWSLGWNHALQAELDTDGPLLLDAAGARRTVGHLGGWGRGRFGPGSSIFHPFSRGTVTEQRLQWMVKGPGSVSLHVRGPRIGRVSRRLDIHSV